MTNAATVELSHGGTLQAKLVLFPVYMPCHAHVQCGQEPASCGS